MQETEITELTDTRTLAVNGYDLYSTKFKKARLAVYVKSGLSVKIIISEECEMIAIVHKDITIIGGYRPFKTSTSTVEDLEKNERICLKLSKKQYSYGLDYSFDYLKQDHKSKLFQNWIEFTDSMGFHQIIREETWSRLVEGIHRKSCLDHLYVTDINVINSYKILDLNIGDHSAVLVDIKINQKTEKSPATKYARQWRNYSEKN